MAGNQGRDRPAATQPQRTPEPGEGLALQAPGTHTGVPAEQPQTQTRVQAPGDTGEPPKTLPSGPGTPCCEPEGREVKAQTKKAAREHSSRGQRGVHVEGQEEPPPGLQLRVACWEGTLLGECDSHSPQGSRAAPAFISSFFPSQTGTRGHPSLALD